MEIELTKEVKSRMLTSIKEFYAESMEADIGDLKAALALEFILKEIAPTVYNVAIADAQAHLQEKVTDLENACYRPEFTYWRR